MEWDQNRVWGWGCLTEDLWMEFFKRTDIKRQGRLQCVCKEWKSVLSSSFFINLHHSFITTGWRPGSLKPLQRAVDSRQCDRRNCSEADHGKLGMTNFPFRFMFRYSRASMVDYVELSLVDVVRGIVCVAYRIDSTFDSILVWNPTIHKYIDLPKLLPPTLEGEEEDPDILDDTYAMGFGYDSESDDFKVVRIWIPTREVAHDDPSLPPAVLDVYSTRQGRLRRRTVAAAEIDLKSCQLPHGRSQLSQKGCFVNGTIYWLLSSDFGDYHRALYYLVLMFDCESEELKTMELPQEMYNNNNNKGVVDASLFDYSGRLCALIQAVSTLGPGWLHLELWAMEEHGSYWTNLCRFSIPCEEEVVKDDIYGYHPWFANLCPPHWTPHPHRYHQRLLCCHSSHSFQESLFLLNHPKAQSYANHETIHRMFHRPPDIFI